MTDLRGRVVLVTGGDGGIGLAATGRRVFATTCAAWPWSWTATDLLAPAAGHQKFVDATIARTPVRRWADPSEMTAALVFLADPTQTFHTGDEIRVDGGYSIF